MKLSSFVLLLALFGLPLAGYAQPYATLKAGYPGAYETTVKSRAAYVYSEPDLEARVVGRYNRDRALLAYNKLGDFYAVATVERGHVGYVLLTDLNVPQDPGAAVAPQRSPLYKDPGTARTTSFALPGGGHLYAGETAKGAALLIASVGSFIGGYALSNDTEAFTCDENFISCETSTDYSYLAGGAVVGAVFWALGVLDAPRAARRTNERNGLTAALRPVPLRVAGHVRPGLALHVRF